MTNHSAKLIWLIEYSNDIDFTLLFKQWQYKIIKIQDDETFSNEIKNHLVKPNLIIINLDSLSKSITNFIYFLARDSTLNDIPLITIGTTEQYNKSQIVIDRYSDFLNKPFELKELYLKLNALLGQELDNQQSTFIQKKTLLFPAIESSSLVKEQEYWLKKFQEYPEYYVWELLKEKGYEVKFNVDEIDNSSAC